MIGRLSHRRREPSLSLELSHVWQIDAPADVAGVRVYTYHLASDAPVLIHEAKFAAASANHDRYGFTGKQLLYDPRGREFEYFCEWMTK